jgi:hypothetical protein
MDLEVNSVKESSSQTKIWTCAGCSTTRDKPAIPRLPKAWHRLEDEAYCPKCWAERYILRAVALPIVSPLGDLTWKDIDTGLHKMWAATTGCANWMLAELWGGDVRRDRSSPAKMPSFERRYLYPAARARFPELPSQTVSSLEQAITAKYRAVRYDIIWRCSAALPTYRYPTPFPIHNQSWKVYLDKDDRIVLSFRVEDRRLEVRLKGGPQFRRQRRAVEQMVNGLAVRGECAIYKRGTATMAKMVAWLPRPEPGPEKTGTLIVRAQKDALVTAFNAKDEKLWTWNADHVVRWAAQHARQLKRWSEDQKAENRPVPDFAERRAAATRKYRDRMESACHQASAYLAGYAARRRFETVHYDDTEKSFCTEFPWARLRTMLAQKLDAQRIQFVPVAASDELEHESPASLAEGEGNAE